MEMYNLIRKTEPWGSFCHQDFPATPKITLSAAQNYNKKQTFFNDTKSHYLKVTMIKTLSILLRDKKDNEFINLIFALTHLTYCTLSAMAQN